MNETLEEVFKILEPLLNMKNKAGEKEMRHHMKDVKEARSSLKKDAGDLKKEIGKKITGALKQDAKIMKDMRLADRKGKK